MTLTLNPLTIAAGCGIVGFIVLALKRLTARY